MIGDLFSEPVDRPSRSTPFPFPNHNTMDPDVMRTKTALNGSFSAAQSAEKPMKLTLS